MANLKDICHDIGGRFFLKNTKVFMVHNMGKTKNVFVIHFMGKLKSFRRPFHGGKEKAFAVHLFGKL